MAASSLDWRRPCSGARGVAFVTTRGAEREFLALARVEPFVIGGRTFTIVGGVAVDEAFLARLARDRAIVVSLRYPGARAVDRFREQPDADGRLPRSASCRFP